jgi:group II intron reverse transcriptase/maturase
VSKDRTKIALQMDLQLEKHGNVQSLMQYINKENLLEQHKNQKGNKATGIDKVTKAEYEKDIYNNIDDLLKSMKKFGYKPQPVRRTYIPKAGSDKLRPLGIPAYEDKLVQGVMADILNAIYENKFCKTSYGFRPDRDCHMAIKELDNLIMRKKVNYIVDADIKGFFDNVDQEWLIKFLEHEIKDKNFIRYIKRFLASGIMDKGQYIESDKGTPQGGLISPILANVYLHYVLDLWFELDIKVRYKGEAYLVRYADDFVCCFENQEEAEKFYVELKERLAKFNLELAEDKTKIIKFGKNANGANESFDFLGFTHKDSIGRTGYYKVIHLTSQKKLKAKKQIAKQWIKNNIRLPIEEIIKKLNVKLIGHYRYYGITDNYSRLKSFRNYIIWELYKRLKRRSQKDKTTIEKYFKILEYNPIAMPKIYFKLW